MVNIDRHQVKEKGIEAISFSFFCLLRQARQGRLLRAEEMLLVTILVHINNFLMREHRSPFYLRARPRVTSEMLFIPRGMHLFYKGY
ncbi:MAG: hypothetical protein VR65_25735 [Desulfobulbaceae bacterium BRH_c16a]|nr:MAG: hypothetical protein VR65_25735 [Desulfobulbaceae bacterium BRH_c16a]